MGRGSRRGRGVCGLWSVVCVSVSVCPVRGLWMGEEEQQQQEEEEQQQEEEGQEEQQQQEEEEEEQQQQQQQPTTPATPTGADTCCRLSL